MYTMIKLWIWFQKIGLTKWIRMNHKNYETYKSNLEWALLTMQGNHCKSYSCIRRCKEIIASYSCMQWFPCSADQVFIASSTDCKLSCSNLRAKKFNGKDNPQKMVWSSGICKGVAGHWTESTLIAVLKSTALIQEKNSSNCRL